MLNAARAAADDFRNFRLDEDDSLVMGKEEDAKQYVRDVNKEYTPVKRRQTTLQIYQRDVPRHGPEGRPDALRAVFPASREDSPLLLRLSFRKSNSLLINKLQYIIC